MLKDYTNYSVEDFLNDPYFISSVNNPTDESRKFWNDQLQYINRKDYEQAVAFIMTLLEQQQQLSAKDENSLLERIHKTNRYFIVSDKRRRFIIKGSIAACIAVFFAISSIYLLKRTFVETDISLIAKELQPMVISDETRLVLPDKKLIQINEQTTSIEHNSDGKLKINSQLIDSVKFQKKTENQFIQLIVPVGKRSTLALNDGSKLWLNAGSRVIYPVDFEKNKREIYVDGEIFIDVIPDKQRPFFVKTNKMNIQVHGTSFNVLAYESDSVQTVVLVNGFISVKTKEEKEKHLTPKMMLSYADGNSVIREVNTDDYTSWRYGLYNSDSENLSVILDRLSRYFGKVIEYDVEVAFLKFSGYLTMQENLDEILEGLCYSAPISIRKEKELYKVSIKEE